MKSRKTFIVGIIAVLIAGFCLGYWLGGVVTDVSKKINESRNIEL